MIVLINNIRFVLLVIITFSHIRLLRGAKQIGSEICLTLDGKRHCYALYGGSDDHETFTWDSAQTICIDSGGQLVQITSPSVQDTLVQQVMSPVTGQGGSVHVWTSGRRSEDGRWHLTTGELMSTDISDMFETTPAGSDRCGFIKNSSTTRPLDDFQCNYRLSRVLCQSTTTSCTAPNISFNGFCYHLYSDSRKLDWNRARQYCRSEPNRDLAYSHFTDAGLLSQLDIVDNYRQYTWIGATSRKWIWDMTNRSSITMEYTKYRGGITDGKCVCIDPNDDGKWDAVSCDDRNSNFICEIIRDVPTTARLPAPTFDDLETSEATSVTISMSSPTPSSTMVPSAGKAVKSPGLERKYVIGAAIAGCVLVAGVVIAVIFVVRRRRLSLAQKPNDMTSSGNNNMSTSVSDVDSRPTATRPTHPAGRENVDQRAVLNGLERQEQGVDEAGYEQVNVRTVARQPTGNEGSVTDHGDYYERPTVYVNMVDRPPNTYDSLHN